MSEHDEPAPTQLEPEVPEKKLGTWQKVLLGLAAVFVIVGFGLKAAGGSSGGEGAGPGGANTFSAQGGGSLVGDGEYVSSAPADDGAASWSPMFLKGGFSFAIAFAVGYALRTFLKITTLFVGAVALGMFAVSYWGGLDLTPLLDKANGAWDSLVGTVQEQASSFKQFMTGHMPSAGGATLGLVSGFKKG